MLARPANRIRPGALVRPPEADRPLVDGLDVAGRICMIESRCRLKARLHAAEARFFADPDRAPLADIAPRPPRAA